jgi:hypothetical protein
MVLVMRRRMALVMRMSYGSLKGHRYKRGLVALRNL